MCSKQENNFHGLQVDDGMIYFLECDYEGQFFRGYEENDLFYMLRQIALRKWRN